MLNVRPCSSTTIEASRALIPKVSSGSSRSGSSMTESDFRRTDELRRARGRGARDQANIRKARHSGVARRSWVTLTRVGAAASARAVSAVLKTAAAINAVVGASARGPRAVRAARATPARAESSGPQAARSESADPARTAEAASPAKATAPAKAAAATKAAATTRPAPTKTAGSVSVRCTGAASHAAGHATFRRAAERKYACDPQNDKRRPPRTVHAMTISKL
jgi:hypothetical protein